MPAARLGFDLHTGAVDEPPAKLGRQVEFKHRLVRHGRFIPKRNIPPNIWEVYPASTIRQ